MEKTSQTSVEARRSFLKKAAYVAPVVIALGTLSAPVSAHASVIFNQGTFDSSGKSFSATEHYDNVANVSIDGTLDYGTAHKEYVQTNFQENSGLLQRFYNLLFRS